MPKVKKIRTNSIGVQTEDKTKDQTKVQTDNSLKTPDDTRLYAESTDRISVPWAYRSYKEKMYFDIGTQTTQIAIPASEFEAEYGIVNGGDFVPPNKATFFVGKPVFSPLTDPLNDLINGNSL